ncbi:MAG: hypoxanthine phosphoribosyltransferase [Candidatus Dasytiphilus stammeri]
MNKINIIRVVLTKDTIQLRMKIIAQSISKYYQNSNNLIVIGLLRGSFIFIADLCREITVPHQIDFMQVSSYANDICSDHNINIIKDLELDIQGKPTLLVDDIIDSGYSLKKIYDFLSLKNPKSLLICALLDKPTCRLVNIEASWIGFTIIGNDFVVGYGMDYAQNYRNLPDIGTLIL